jgi:hypothetical protein
MLDPAIKLLRDLIAIDSVNPQRGRAATKQVYAKTISQRTHYVPS